MSKQKTRKIYHIEGVISGFVPNVSHYPQALTSKNPGVATEVLGCLERETRLELATSTLARLRSTN
jgi:hypothetical protein